MRILSNNYMFKGYVSHYRFQPKIHKFKYKVFKTHREKIKFLFFK